MTSQWIADFLPLLCAVRDVIVIAVCVIVPPAFGILYSVHLFNRE